jgi:5-methyltetrahydropteroyltriglutamate--homocysteine methyltransferase
LGLWHNPSERCTKTAHESSFLHRHAAAPFKITLPAASQIVSSHWQWGVSEQAYHSASALYPEIVGIVRCEIEAVVAEGVPYIQIDAPRYTYFVDERWRQRFRDRGEDPGAVMDQWIEADNASLAGIRPQGATIAMHLCRGNNRGAWFGEGSYAPIAEKLFNAIAVERFLLEFDSERAGGFAPLRLVPRDKIVVLGLVVYLYLADNWYGPVRSR